MVERRDAVVVGGGLVGLALAWRARQRGLDVVVLERDEAGAAASSVGAGILAPVSETTARAGTVEFAIASADAYPSFVAELAEASGCEIDFRRCGVLHLAGDDAEAAQLRALAELQAAHGREAAWLDADGCRELEPRAGRCVGGLDVPDDGLVDPRMLTRALVRVLDDAVEAGREATGLLLEAGRVAGVETARGPVRAATVVVAAGAWSGALAWLPPEARPPVRPVKGQLVVLRPPAGASSPRLCERVVWSHDVYVATRGDGRVVVGGTVEEAGFDTTVTPEAVECLLAAGSEAVPALAEYELAESLAALRPAADGGPLVGPGALPGLVLATGHFRNGILLAPATADAIAALLAGA